MQLHEKLEAVSDDELSSVDNNHLQGQDAINDNDQRPEDDPEVDSAHGDEQAVDEARPSRLTDGVSHSPATSGTVPVHKPATLPSRKPASSPQATSPRSSLAQQLQRRSTSDDPPLPHLPQRHFSREPDMGYGLNQESQILPGARHYHCGFDTLNGATAEQTDVAHNIVLVGSEGGLDTVSYTHLTLPTIYSV